MGRVAIHLALLMGGAFVLAGCGLADSRAPLPEFLRGRPADPQADPPPDVPQTVRNNLNSVFVASSYPRDVRVSPPLHEPNGPGWTACVTAELTSVTGRPLGSETYRITIKDGEITDRRRAEADDNCPSQNYQPI